jgi:BirA family biotin operon repressor/biotin-[acetyl-CoA-carboxylase] ligase
MREHERMYKFIELLRGPVSGYASGQSLARKAGISRSAVWKQVNKLRRSGYGIESLHGRGYRLVRQTEHPVPWELERILKTSSIGRRMVYRESAGSTQDIAISLAEKGAQHGTVVIAEQQRSGRGRMKRRWLSPRGGLWLSVVLKPSIPTAASTMLPLMAAAAVCDAVSECTKLPASLKWPNDVLVGGKKVAGILLDISAEAETVNYAVVGMGINANVDSAKLKVDRRDRPAITSLRDELGRDINRLQLAKILLERLEQYYLLLEDRGPAAVLDLWRSRSDMLGKKVSVVQQGRTLHGVAADINDDGSLLLRTTDGEVAVTHGDVLLER